MNEFLNPKSMATPGAAGGVTMFIANAVSNNFPEIPFRYTCLGLSLLIGLVIHISSELDLPSRAGFFVINSLIIFAMGVGTSNIGANIVQAKQIDHASSLQQQPHADTLSSFFLESAVAQTNSSASATANSSVERLESENKDLHTQIGDLHQKNLALNSEISKLKDGNDTDSDLNPSLGVNQKNIARQGFFNRW